jgi:hypothetical protein
VEQLEDLRPFFHEDAAVTLRLPEGYSLAQGFEGILRS